MVPNDRTWICTEEKKTLGHIRPGKYVCRMQKGVHLFKALADETRLRCAGSRLHWSMGGAHLMVTPCFFESGCCTFRTSSTASAGLSDKSFALILDAGKEALK
jgi:hypothetical protein